MVLMSTCCLMALYICERAHENISNGFQLTEQTWVPGGNGYVQCSKDNDSKSIQIRVTVYVFCTSSHSALYLCELSWNIAKGIRVIERTRVHGRNGYFQYLWCSKGRNSKGRLTRVMVLMFCMSSHDALHLWGISWKYLQQLSTYRADMSTWWKWLCSMFKGQ